ncbi:MAG: FAD-binding protein [Fimbriimonas sp.]
MAEKLRNWAGNYEYAADRVHRPKSIEELQAVLAGARKVRALGTRHSFNGIADTPEDLVSTEHFNGILSLDREKATVTVGGGLPYGRLCDYLHREGFALHNLASLPHISIAGACATATHGSGDANGCLSTAVSAMEIVKADGTVVNLSRAEDPDVFPGAVVNLGGLGVVTQVTLDLVPTFNLQQEVYEGLSLDALEDDFEAIESTAYSVSLFTDWTSSRINQVWIKRRVTEAEPLASEFYGATRAPDNRHPIGDLSPVNCTEQMGVPGPWHERMPHFRMDFTPSSGEELQAEYIVPRRHALGALRAVEGMRGRIAPLLQISEVRTVAADDLWMSPSYGQPCVCIHFTLKPDWEGVKGLLPEIDAIMEPFEARPHWGKLFSMAPKRLQALYPRLTDFRWLLEQFDPEGKFRNPFLDRYIF